mmetsp:Transcript_46130/g.55919  ORF Transcript_46130/g.55919 Transcript_46130/m.55919 type:complete len:165 (+) Transcript_46130:72-566(+)
MMKQSLSPVPPFSYSSDLTPLGGMVIGSNSKLSNGSPNLSNASNSFSISSRTNIGGSPSTKNRKKTWSYDSQASNEDPKEMSSNQTNQTNENGSSQPTLENNSDGNRTINTNGDLDPIKETKPENKSETVSSPKDSQVGGEETLENGNSLLRSTLSPTLLTIAD